MLGSLHAGVNLPWVACLSAAREPFIARGAVDAVRAAQRASWIRWRLRSNGAGFVFGDTIFRYAVSRSRPLLAELFL